MSKTLISITEFSYGSKPIKDGDEFEATDVDAAYLIATSKAKAGKSDKPKADKPVPEAKPVHEAKPVEKPAEPKTDDGKADMLMTTKDMHIEDTSKGTYQRKDVAAK